MTKSFVSATMTRVSFWETSSSGMHAVCVIETRFFSSSPSKRTRFEEPRYRAIREDYRDRFLNLHQHGFGKPASSPAATSAPKGIKRHKRTIEQTLPFLAGHEGFRLSWQRVVHDAVSSLWQAASLTEANRSNHRSLESPNRSNFIIGKCLQQRCAEPHKRGINKRSMLLVRSSS